MSGGVDSAVALLARPEAGHEPVGVTLRLWIDPAGPDAERACCSPEAVVAARETCHAPRRPARHARPARGVPPRGRRALRRRLRARRDAEPLHALQRRLPLRRAARVRAPDRRRQARHRPLRAASREHRGRLLLARAADAAKDQSYMLARLDPRRLARLWFPLGEPGQGRDARRGARAGLAAAGRAESQEACFLGGRRLPRVPRAPRARRERGPGRRRGRARARRATTASGASRPAAARPRRRRAASRCTRCATDPRTNTVVVGPARRARAPRVSASAGRLFVPVERVEAKLRYRSPAIAARASRPHGAGSASRSTSPRTASRRARRPCSTRATPSSAPALVSSAR